MLNMTYSYRIYPDQEQSARMEEWLEQLRQVYNYYLGERKDWINSRKCEVNACSIRHEYIIPADTPRPTFYSQKLHLTQAKKEFPALTDIHSQVLQEVVGRVDLAFKNMWEQGLGFPRFKKRGRMRSFVFPQFKTNPITGWQIKLPKIGNVRINLHRPIPGGFDVKIARIVRKASGWFVLLTLQADVKVPEIQPHGHPLGIDMGLEKFLATSDGELVARPRFFNLLQRKLKLLQRRLKHKKKGSSNWRKLNQKIGRLHEKINNTRKDYHYKTAHHLCDAAGMIFAEDLDLKAMSRGMLCKHTLDAGFGQFLSILSWVCWKRGVYFTKVDASGTSQICPKCHTHTGKKELSQRVHDCCECGYKTDRDVAAAEVVVQRGISAVGHAVAQIVCGDDLTGAAMPTQESVKQKFSKATLRSPRHTR